MASGRGTLVDAVFERAAHDGARVAFRFVAGDAFGAELTYAQLAEQAVRRAASLQARFERGALLVLAMPTSPAAVVTAVGAMLAGLLPAVMPPPGHPRDARNLQRLLRVLRQHADAGLCVTAEARSALLRAGDDAAQLAARALEVADDGACDDGAAAWRDPHAGPDDGAYVQYTSGSTQAPRGALLTHGNLLANSDLIRDVFAHDDGVRMLSWLPLHHDMGFIAHVVHAVHVGAHSMLAPPSWFAQDPLRWLETIARERVATSGAPPFAYAACLRAALRDEPRLRGLDLSSWRNAYVGAEPVAPALLAEFARTFARCGLRDDALLPCYGLAEATLFVAGGHVAPAALGERVRYRVYPAVDVEVRDPRTGAACANAAEGEIVLGGPTISREYYRDAAATAATRWPSAAGPALRTGDLGRLDGGELTITGRLKDVIVVRGGNLHAGDVEEIARGADERLRHEAIAAVALPGASTERLAVVAEAKLGGGPAAAAQADALRASIADAVAAGTGVVPDPVRLVRRGSLPRTTSGKLARSEVRAALLEGRLDAVPAGAQARGTPDRADGVQPQEPVAIVGMACRFPGADDADAFWDALAAGTDLITEVPRERWDADAYYDPRVAMPGKMNTRWGGFVAGADLFDATFFGIAAHEAVEMDPQQRLLLETAWRAFEHAGIAGDALAGSATGVFVGISTNDYLQLQIAQDHALERFNAYSGLGSATSIAANRLSYTFDLRGPSMAVDTACSSSLTAIHLAVRSLRGGECAQAIAGGVSLMLSPGTTVALSQFGMMAPDGRCKVFDQSADGYVRSEGCGLIVLKRLSDARRDGDRILAIVRGSALAQDGRTPGITAPNADAQARLIRAALADASTEPAQVTYVEAHGTGTPTGDPAEMQEIKRIYGFAPGLRCHVGSVKANAGHLEAAAGVASTIKTVQALRRGAIPPHLHLRELSDRIDLSGSRLHIPRELAAWRTGGGARVAAVSSFGFGGALAHLILEAVPADVAANARAGSDGPWLVPLSANDGDALASYAGALRAALARPGAPQVADVAHTLGSRRTHFAARAFAVARDTAALAERLAAVAPRDAAPANGVAFLFSGQGSQWAGMGRGLHARFPAFRSAFDRCAEAFAAAAPGAPALADVAFDDDGARLDTAALLQPALFALEYALAALWRSFGVVPAAVMGHSLGEIVAAAVAGCVDVEDAVALVAARGALMQTIAEPGAMAAVRASAADVERLLAAWRLDRMEIAAVNGAQNVVLAGPAAAVAGALERLAAERIAARPLRTPQAFHSPLMDGVLDAFERAASRAAWRAPAIPLISNVTGEPLAGAPDAAYWRTHVRARVRFTDGLAALGARGITHAVEIGPGDTLAQLAREAGANGTPLVAVPSLARGADEAESVLTAAGELYCAQVTLDWDGVLGDASGAPPRQVVGELPGHPFRRQRYWFDDGAPPAQRHTTAAAREPVRAAQREWRYDVAWEPAPLLGDAAALADDADRNWIVVGDGRGLGAALAARLTTRGRKAYHVLPSAEHAKLRRVVDGTTGVVRLLAGDPSSADAMSAALGEILNRLAPAGAQRWNVIAVGALDATPSGALDVASLEADQRRTGPGALTALAQAVVRTALGIRVWIVTAGAQAVDDRAPVEVSQSTAWGFGVTLFLEHPEMRGGLIDLAAGAAPEAASDDVLGAVAAGDDEPFAASRSGRRMLPRLRPTPAGAAAAPPAYGPDGTYLVTGGLGGLGLATALRLAQRGARHVVLLGRTPLPPSDTWDAPDHPPEVRERIAGVRRISALGASVSVVAADVNDHAHLRQLIDACARQGQPLRGVVHAAGVNWFERIADVDNEKLLDALRVNVSAAWALHELTRDLPLDLFVLYSSVSALWGSVDLAHYTASNAFLDALALHRRALGLSALSVDWGPWGLVGMSAKPKEIALLGKLGLRLMPPERALDALEACVSSGAARAVIADVDWERFAAFIAFATSPSFFADVAGDGAAAAAAHGRHPFDALRDEAPAAAYARIVAFVRRELATVMLRQPGTEAALDQRFNLMGMDSLMAISFALRLETIVGRKLPTTLAYNYPTIADLARHLFELVRGESFDPAVAAPPPVPQIARNGAAWFPSYDAEGTARADRKPLLFCLPYAGAGASLYREWAHALADVADVVAIQPPGREERHGEAPATTMAELVGGLADALERHVLRSGGPPYALFGHSLGGLAAFELALELRRRGLAAPSLLVLSGCALPDGAARAAGDAPLHGLDDDAFRARVAESFALPPDLRDGVLWDALAPVLRADLRVLETYRPNGDAALDVPFAVLGATGDALAPPERLLAWRGWASNGFSLHLFEGGHMFVRDDPAAVKALVRDVLSRGAERAAAVP
jgi:acyl transferase domain-containing protein/acyl-CoA synthetase (AMP-forming)/AMP-acid ligase II/surfactin synthase thioesterase subunit/acyl carrier protein